MASRSVGENQLQRIIRDLQDAVTELSQEHREGGEPVTDDNSSLHKFCYKLEYLLQFDQKEKSTLLGIRKDYWDYFCDCLGKTRGSNDGIRFVKSIPELKTSLGKGRAFIRYSLVHQRLADTLQQCLMNQRVTSDWYYMRSPFVQPHLNVDIVNHLYELNEVQFDVASRGHDLDSAWPTFARRSLGSPASPWKPPSRCSSIGSLAGPFSPAHTDYASSPDYDNLPRHLNETPSCNVADDLRLELDQSELRQQELRMQLSQSEKQLQKVHAELSQSEKQRQELRAELNQWQQKQQELLEEVRRREEEVAEFRAAVEDLRSRPEGVGLGEAGQERAELKHADSARQERSEGEKAQPEEVQEALGRLQGALTDREQEVGKLRRQLQEQEEAQRTQAGLRETLERQVQQLEEQLRAREPELLREAEPTTGAELQMRGGLREEEAESQLEISRLQEEVLELQVRLQEVTETAAARLEVAEAEKEALRVQVEEVQSGRLENEAQKEEREVLRVQVEQQQSQLEEVQRGRMEEEAQKEDREGLQVLVKKLQSQLEELQRGRMEEEKQKEEKEALRVQVEQQQSQLEEVQRGRMEEEAQKEDREVLPVQVKELQSQLEELQRGRMEEEKQKEEKEALRVQVEQLQSQLEEVQRGRMEEEAQKEEKEVLQVQVEQLQSQLEEVQRGRMEEEAQKEEKEALQVQVKEPQSQLEELQRGRMGEEAWKEEKEALQMQVKELQSQLEEVQRDRTEEEAQKEDKEVVELKDQQAQVTLELAEVREELHHANAAMAELGVATCALTAKKEEAARQLVELEAEKAALKAENDALRAELEVEKVTLKVVLETEKGGLKADLQTENGALRAELQAREEELCQAQEKLPEAVRDLQARLEEAELRAHEEADALRFQMSSETMSHQKQLQGLNDELGAAKAELERLSFLPAKESELQTADSCHSQLLEEKAQHIAKCERELQMLGDNLTRTEQELADSRNVCVGLRKSLDKACEEKQSSQLKMAAEIDDLNRTKSNLEERLIQLIREKDALWQKSDALEFQQKQWRVEELERAEREAESCAACHSQFGWLNRRHHCGLCSRAFCSSCCSRTAAMRQGGRKERCCKDCHTLPETPTSPPSRPADTTTGVDDVVFDIITEDEAASAEGQQGVLERSSSTSTADTTSEDPEEQTPVLQDPEIYLLKSGELTLSVVLSLVEATQFGDDSRELFIKSSGYSVISVGVSEGEPTLGWVFSSEPKSIYFCVLYREGPHALPEECQVLIPLTRCNSHKEAVRGQLLVKNPGTYLLIFDNSFSRFVSKKVLYRLTVNQPVVCNGSDSP